MFLDEMLDSLPRPAFASAAAAEAQRRQEEEEEAAADLERLCGEADGYEQIRSRRREQQAARDFSMRFIAEWGGRLQPPRTCVLFVLCPLVAPTPEPRPGAGTEASYPQSSCCAGWTSRAPPTPPRSA